MKIEYVNGDKMVNLNEVIQFLNKHKLNCPGFETNDFDIGWNKGIDGIVEEINKLNS